ncbi:MAG: preprotein translocase subunit YajC [candidate division WOR-3 bacterium]|uniref:Preprotein translocase subunit YajC n=1 Tax=candidate division WOR-3 bacterium TaxID=2052148 RepID=A0A7C1NTA8_UNCW3|nr:preprotein translocase subunit YajC [candidate division WOR-3 bacterium]
MLIIAFAQNQTQPQSGGGLGFIGSILPLILIFVVLYFLIILPQQRRQKKHQEMLASLKRGDRVVFASGILGVITNVKENTFIVKIAENTEVEVEKSAIAYKIGSSS